MLLLNYKTKRNLGCTVVLHQQLYVSFLASDLYIRNLQQKGSGPGVYLLRYDN